MYPLIRLAKTIIGSLLAPRLDPKGVSSISLRVWPNDLDINFHMTNGRYLTMMDLGRFDLSIRAGLVGIALKEKWAPVLGASAIRYRRSLKPFARYNLETQIVGWDEKWFYMEQRFVHKGDVYAVALAKGLFKRGRGTVPTREISDFLGVDFDDMPRPAYIAHWIDMEDGMRQNLKENTETTEQYEQERQWAR